MTASPTPSASTWSTRTSGQAFGYTVRILPEHVGLAVPQEMGLQVLPLAGETRQTS